MSKEEETPTTPEAEQGDTVAPTEMLAIAATAASSLMADYDFSVKGIMNSIAKRASLDRERTLEVPPSLPRMLEEVPSRKAFIQELVEQEGSCAKWMEVKEIHGVPVQRLANVTYGKESPLQSMDLYFPLGGVGSNDKADDIEAPHLLLEADKSTDAENDELITHATGEDKEVNTSEQSKESEDTVTGEEAGNITSEEEANKKRPVYIHIHGGGWSRGSKETTFYGGPAMCQNAVAEAGCISVAIGYRLGRYPEFMHDAAQGIKWVYDNIESLGGDVDNVFLSGHSAGGHISSLLILRHNTFLQPLGIPMSFFKGLVLVSGVYDLFKPMKMRCVDAKNKWFALAYATPAFGTDTQLKRDASPLLLLDPSKDTSLVGPAMRAVMPRVSLKKRFPVRKLSKLVAQSSYYVFGDDSNKEERQPPIEYRDGDNDLPPPTLILNATYDMGLEENGQLMAEAMSEYTPVRYMIIEGSDHASICWHDKTSKAVADFVADRRQVVKQKQRRGKRDKTQS